MLTQYRGENKDRKKEWTNEPKNDTMEDIDTDHLARQTRIDTQIIINIDKEVGGTTESQSAKET